MKVIILAGGYATRLWPLTKERAKPLLLLNGKPLISHIIDKIPDELEIILCTNQKFSKSFKEWKNHWHKDRNIIIAVEKTHSEKQKFGALGAIVECIKRFDIKEDIWVIGGDNFFGFSLENFISKYKGAPLIAAYDIGPLKEARKFGVLTVKRGRVVEFTEKPENPNSTLVNTMCAILPQSSFCHLFEAVKKHADNFGSLIEYFINEAKIDVQAYISNKDWFDIGSFEGYIKAHKKVEREKEHRGQYLGGDFWGKNTLVGKVFIDKGTVVRDSYLEDCIILSDCDITNSKIKNCIIDEGCTIRNCDLSYEMLEKGRKVNCKNSTKCRIGKSLSRQ